MKLNIQTIYKVLNKYTHGDFYCSNSDPAEFGIYYHHSETAASCASDLIAAGINVRQNGNYVELIGYSNADYAELCKILE